MDWTELEARLNAQDLKAFVDGHVIPQLSELDTESETVGGPPKSLTRAITICFFAFVVSFMIIESLLPRSALGIISGFVIFPVLFFGFMALGVYSMRNTIADFITKAQNNFIIRNAALGRIAAHLDLVYVPMPGGPSKGLKLFAKWKHCPGKIKDVVEMMDSESGLQFQSDVIRKSGMVIPSDVVIGSEESKTKYYETAQENLQFEDGFSGSRNGVDFAVMEFEERHDEVSYHHLLIHLTLPHSLTSWVEFKNKAGKWPKSRPNVDLKKVTVPYSPFSKAYDIRASDQTEARLVFDPVVIEALSQFAANAPSRGVAFDNHLVFDVRGENRFELVDVATGVWSEESLKQTFTDIADMLALVDAVSHSFVSKTRRIV